MVVAVQAGKEKEHGDFLANEGSVIAGGVAALGILEMQAAALGRVFDSGPERRAGADAADKHLVVLDAADHAGDR